MPVITPSNPSVLSVNQFPIVLSTGALARYPMARLRTYSTSITKFADFSEQRFAQIAAPLMTWDLTMSQLLDSEFNDCQVFYDAQLGSNGTFTFLDPFDNLLAYSEAFETVTAWSLGAGTFIGQNYFLNSQDLEKAPWGLSNTGTSNPTVTADANAAPDGTTTADTIAFPSIPNTSGDNSFIYQSASPPVVPNMAFTFSVWLRVASGTGTININLADSPQTAAQSTVCSLTTSWQRFSVTTSFGGSANPALIALIVNPQNSPAVTVWAWGAQLEYGSAASDYSPTTTATAVIQVADPFFQQAPSSVAGYQWNLNSAYARRGRQLVVTASPTGKIFQLQGIAPGGTGNSRTKGLTLTSSLYVKQQTASPPTAALYTTDGTFESSSVPVTPSSSWQRLQATKQFSASNNQSTAGISLQGFSGAGTVYVFGAQLEAESAASAYKYSANISGVHTKCHFMGDEMAHLLSEFNQNVFENSQRTRVGGSRLADVITIYESA